MDKIRACLRRLFDSTFLRFILVGVVNTLFGSAVMFSLYNLLLYPYRWGYWVSSAANYVFGSILSYILNKRFTFRNTERGVKPLLRFAVNIGLCYFIAYGVAKPAVGLILSGSGQRLQENAAMLTGMGLFVVLNYLGQRFFAFKKK